MKKLLFLLLLLSAPAQAYDDKVSLGKYLDCLVKHQSVAHYGPRQMYTLIGECQPEEADFQRYNCPGDPDACGDTAMLAAQMVIQRVK